MRTQSFLAVLWCLCFTHSLALLKPRIPGVSKRMDKFPFPECVDCELKDKIMAEIHPLMQVPRVSRDACVSPAILSVAEVRDYTLSMASAQLHFPSLVGVYPNKNPPLANEALNTSSNLNLPK